MNKRASMTRYIIKIYIHEKELSNKNVFSCRLNAVNEGAEVTLGGRLFHAVPPSRGMNSRQSCAVAFAARSVVGESQNINVVALLPRRSSAGHGRGTVAPCCDDSRRQARPVGSVLSPEPTTSASHGADE